MQVEKTDFPGLFQLVPRVFPDGRGYFMESWNKARMAGLGLDYDWVQDNHARSQRKGVLRGLHFQLPPSAQAKLVRVSVGAVRDVVVDLRRGSPSFGRWHSVDLSAENHRQLLIPPGFAHGYLTLTDVVEFQYKVDAYYDPEADSGLFWADPDIGVDWGVAEPVLSDKDKALGRFKDFDSPFVYDAAGVRA